LGLAGRQLGRDADAGEPGEARAEGVADEADLISGVHSGFEDDVGELPWRCPRPETRRSGQRDPGGMVPVECCDLEQHQERQDDPGGSKAPTRQDDVV